MRLGGDRESRGGQIEDQTAIHLLVETEVEIVEGPLRLAELKKVGVAGTAGLPTLASPQRRAYRHSG